MQNKLFDRLLAFALFFITYWLFGNLYEEIVLAPNHLSNTYETLLSWQKYFLLTNPIFYYVPFTQIAVIVVWVLYTKSTDTIQKQYLKKASIFGLLALVLTVAIVTQLNLKLFFGDLNRYKNQLYTLSVIWLIGNAVRIYLLGNSLHFLIKTYMLRQIQKVDKI